MSNIEQQPQQPIKSLRGLSLKDLLQKEDIRARFQEMLGSKASGFMSSIISAQNANEKLAQCEPMSIVGAAAIAASMDLPINSSLGFAHIVPYGNQAQFQIGWKGFVQLAMRTGQYKTLNVAKVYEGQIKNFNGFTGEMEFNFSAKSDKVVGYVMYFKLLNGYEKYYYMTKDECEKHGAKFSKSYNFNTSVWKSNFDAMAMKTVCKMGLSRYGVLSVEMQKAISADQGITTSIEADAQVIYADNFDENKAQAVEQLTNKARELKQAVELDVVEIQDDEPTIEAKPTEPVSELWEQVEAAKKRGRPRKQGEFPIERESTNEPSN